MGGIDIVTSLTEKGQMSEDSHVSLTNHCAQNSANKNALRSYLCVKYVFDFIVSLILSIVLLVPMLLVALCIRIDSPGAPIFTQTRIGQNGKPFKVYKFRTMDRSAPSDLPTSLFLDADKYITRIGGFLRRTSLDELPQIWNVLKGDMSFVGFRPVCTTECKLNALREAYGVFACRPGITGYAQIHGRDDLHYAKKAELDAEYLHRRSIRLDLYCLIQTVPVTISQKGVK